MTSGVRFTDPETSHLAAEDQIENNAVYERKALRWLYDHDREQGWIGAEFETAIPAGYIGSCYWRRLTSLRDAGWVAVIGTRVNPASGQSTMINRITGKGCEELGRPVLPDLPTAQERLVRRRYTLEQFADQIEARQSLLCDCEPESYPPGNFETGEMLEHHCDCAAVLASKTIRKGSSRTRHAAACTCDG